MYSTLDGAKSQAKQLRRILSASGLIYPLSKCQTAVARAGGFLDWHDLASRLPSSSERRSLFDFWGALLQNLPVPCQFPVRSYLRDAGHAGSNTKDLSENWVRDVIPYCASLELVHRRHSPLLMPGSGKGQRLRLEIVAGMLLIIEGHKDFSPRLDPDTLSIVFENQPRSLLPKLSKRPDFDREVSALVAAQIIQVEERKTTILAPRDQAMRGEIIRRALEWNSQKEPLVPTFEISAELAAQLRHQNELDRAGCGEKVPYDELEHRGVILVSRFSVKHEFETMKNVVDAMGPLVRPRISSVYCDSRACAVYSVEIKLGMNKDSLPKEVQSLFIQATDGFNGLTVNHGASTEFFNPEWPGFEMEDLDAKIDETVVF
ncbi:hypothetical protein [Rhizobium leguminosarum]